MTRSVQSYGMTRTEFEADFTRYCKDNEFSPGAKCAEMLNTTNDARVYGFLLGIAHKFLTESATDGDMGQGSLLIEWRANEPEREVA
jgi:hypothetical protein